MTDAPSQIKSIREVWTESRLRVPLLILAGGALALNCWLITATLLSGPVGWMASCSNSSTADDHLVKSIDADSTRHYSMTCKPFAASGQTLAFAFGTFAVLAAPELLSLFPIRIKFGDWLDVDTRNENPLAKVAVAAQASAASLEPGP
jgi:hypothetical protein